MSWVPADEKAACLQQVHDGFLEPTRVLACVAILCAQLALVSRVTIGKDFASPAVGAAAAAASPTSADYWCVAGSRSFAALLFACDCFLCVRPG